MALRITKLAKMTELFYIFRADSLKQTDNSSLIIASVISVPLVTLSVALLLVVYWRKQNSQVRPAS